MHAAAHGACDMEILDGGSLNPREGSNKVIVTTCDFNRQGVSVAVKDAFERFGEWLKIKTGNGKDSEFVNAFVTTSQVLKIAA